MEDLAEKITYVCAVKENETVRLADIIIGPDIEGRYRFNMINVKFYGTDREHRAYQFDDLGNVREIESAYFDDEKILEEAATFGQLKARLDRRIRKRLVWAEEKPSKFRDPAKRLCIGIR